MVGTVVRGVGADTVPLTEHWAVLHQVTPLGGGPVDSARTDRLGRYRLAAEGADTTARYVVSVGFGGIAYFTEPLRFPAVRADTAAPLIVYDTSSTAPAIRLAQRHMVVRDREPDGSRRVIELLVLANDGTRTRISPDSTRPVWVGRLPAGAIRFDMGESDMDERAVLKRGDTLSVIAPIPPGERQLLVSYVLPASARTLVIPFDQPVERVSLMLEDTAATVDGGALTLRGFEELDELVVRRFGGADVATGSPVVVRFSSVPFAPTALWWLVVPVAAVAMAAALIRWWRRTAPARAADDPEVLAAQIAALDAQFETGATDEYRRRRAELKRRLHAVLARGRHGV